MTGSRKFSGDRRAARGGRGFTVNEPEEDEDGTSVARILAAEEQEETEEEEIANPEKVSQAKKSTVDRLSTTRADWEKAIAALQIPVPDKTRLRTGQPCWTRQSQLAHLSRVDEPTPERMVAAWEYVLVNRKPMPFYPAQYVARQKAALTHNAINNCALTR